MNLSLIISTYNQLDYLARILQAILAQTLAPMQLLLADDGSESDTRQFFQGWAAQQKFSCDHLWQEHRGFRKSRILNQSIAMARGDYLVFLDGDTIPHPKFLADHQEFARPGFFVQGHRALIQKNGAEYFGKGNFPADRRRALFSGQLRGLKHAFRWPWPLPKVRVDLQGVRGCNFGVWRADLVAINGYNEAFEGWGREDSELVVRLFNNHIQRLDIRGRAICYHLWHPPAPRDRLTQNDCLLESAQKQALRRCQLGLDQYL